MPGKKLVRMYRKHTCQR